MKTHYLLKIHQVVMKTSNIVNALIWRYYERCNMGCNSIVFSNQLRLFCHRFCARKKGRWQLSCIILVSSQDWFLYDGCCGQENIKVHFFRATNTISTWFLPGAFKKHSSSFHVVQFTQAGLVLKVGILKMKHDQSFSQWDMGNNAGITIGCFILKFIFHGTSIHFHGTTRL